MEIVTIVFALLTGIFAGVAYQLWLRNLNYRQRIFELTIKTKRL